LDVCVCVCVWEQCILQIRILGKYIFEYVMKLQIRSVLFRFVSFLFQLCCHNML